MESSLDIGVGPKDQKLPNDIAVLVLGIVSIAMCGVGLVTGIIALVLSGKSMSLHKTSPELYSESSYSMLNSGRICAIVGVCLSSLIIIVYICYFAFVFSLIGAGAISS